MTSDKWECHYEAENGTDPYDYKLSEMLKCRGCETVSLRVTSKDADDERATVVYYPPAIARRMPDWAEVRFRSALAQSLYLLDMDDEPYVPEDLWHLMREVYVAVQNDARRLAAMGIRAALENVMIDKIGGDKGSFTANVDAFQAAGYLNVRQRGHLEAVLGAGHAVIHRGWQPKDSELIILLDITEAIIEGAYLHDKPADTLSRSIPLRPPRLPRKS